MGNIAFTRNCDELEEAFEICRYTAEYILRWVEFILLVCACSEYVENLLFFLQIY